MTNDQIKEIERSYSIISGAIRRQVQIESEISELLKVEESLEDQDLKKKNREKRFSLMTEHSQAAGVVRSMVLGFHSAIWMFRALGMEETFYDTSEKNADELDSKAMRKQ